MKSHGEKSSESPDDIDFKAERHESHEASGSHGTEMGWLVSYADMMTLLFGLFVILYTLRTDKTKDADQVMREISREYFNHTAEAPKTPVPPPVDPVEQLQKQFEKTLAIKNQQITEATEKMVAMTTQTDQLQQQIKTLQQQIADSKSVEETVKTLTAKNQELKVELAHSKKPVEKTRAPQSIPTEQQVHDLEQEITRIQSENSELQQTNSQLTSQTAQLKKEVEESRQQQAYLVVILSWETEKHDLDLNIQTPGKASFDFKHRKIKGVSGELQIDSRFGPGIEMWKSDKFEVGQYAARIHFYNSNGNSENARAQLTVMTNKESYRSQKLEIPISKKNLEIRFDVDDKGHIHALQ
jgi:flagellar motor protein MotB